jgi:hypothetical protein
MATFRDKGGISVLAFLSKYAPSFMASQMVLKSQARGSVRCRSVWIVFCVHEQDEAIAIFAEKWKKLQHQAI